MRGVFVPCDNIDPAKCSLFDETIHEVWGYGWQHFIPFPPRRVRVGAEKITVQDDPNRPGWILRCSCRVWSHYAPIHMRPIDLASAVRWHFASYHGS